MRHLKYLLAATAASLLSTAALAADLPIAPPPAYAPPPPADFGGWYLRGDIGMSNQSVKRLDTPGYHDPGITVPRTNGLGFDSAGIYGVGVGYRFNNWFRADLTGEYRGKANLHGLDIVSFNGNVIGTDEYHGSKSEWLFLANAYVDLGTWWCVTPFIGAGVGMSRNTISGFQDINTPNLSVAFAPDASKWSFAWAAHAGLAYKVTPSTTIELAYRYVDLGNGSTGALTNYFGFTRGRTIEFKDITSQDVRLGVRWSLEPTPVYAPPPLITKG
ncbi:outer membrane protein [Bradyrhizobium sp. 2TAF24]|uniref:outer membrane protein n=1 Tax=Bradyrhizobium sp. 2TAF24 TaxID=3233011 RepID=UPI003F92723A